jgi:5-oxoprolinase (ATP-hydrolysing) subunit A
LRRVDLNCDLGESFGVYRYGEDTALMPLISSANIACGFHAGDPHIIRESVQLASEHGVKIGAHIGFPDRLGFGRREIAITPEQAYDYILYQLGALDAFLKAERLYMTHMKLHGAFYMMAAARKDIAESTIKAVQSYDRSLDIFCLPHSELAVLALESGLNIKTEYFADRPYSGSKVRMFGWSLEDLGSLNDLSERALSALEESRSSIPIDTICVHSDTPGSPAIMKAIREKLVSSGWTIGAAIEEIVP